MKLAEIEVGKTYSVMIPEHEDVSAFCRRRYDGKDTTAEVVEVGIHYMVPRYATWGGIRGSNGRPPRVLDRWEESARADGVKVGWDQYGKWTTAIIPCRNVLSKVQP